VTATIERAMKPSQAPSTLLRSILPYGIGAVLAAALFVYTGHIDYTPRPGQIGPATWPRLVMALMAGSCLFEIARRIVTRNAEAAGVIDALDRDDETQPETRYPLSLVAGIVLVAIYAFVVPYLGFLLGTFLFLAAFMYVGGYRRHLVIWAASAIVTLFCGVLFLRIAYVSLPRGIPPFDRVTDAFLVIPGL
jgi:putative tricarboxylic transport membrane protein